MHALGCQRTQTPTQPTPSRTHACIHTLNRGDGDGGGQVFTCAHNTLTPPTHPLTHTHTHIHTHTHTHTYTPGRDDGGCVAAAAAPAAAGGGPALIPPPIPPIPAKPMGPSGMPKLPRRASMFIFRGPPGMEPPMMGMPSSVGCR